MKRHSFSHSLYDGEGQSRVDLHQFRGVSLSENSAFFDFCQQLITLFHIQECHILASSVREINISMNYAGFYVLKHILDVQDLQVQFNLIHLILGLSILLYLLNQINKNITRS